MKAKRTTKRVMAWILALATVITTVTPSNLSISAEETASTEITEEAVQEVTTEQEEETSEDETTEVITTEEATTESVKEEDVSSEETKSTEATSEDATVETTEETTTEEVTTEVKSDKETSDKDEETKKEEDTVGSLSVKVSEGGTIKFIYEDGTTEVVEKKEDGLHSTKGINDVLVKDLQEGYYKVIESKVDCLVKVEVTSKDGFKIESYSKEIDNGKDIVNSFENGLQYNSSIKIENKAVKLEVKFSELENTKLNLDDEIEVIELGDAVPEDAHFTSWDSSWNFKDANGKTYLKRLKEWCNSAESTAAGDRTRVQKLYMEAKNADVSKKGFSDSYTFDKLKGEAVGQIDSQSSAKIKITGSSYKNWVITGVTCCSKTAAPISSGTTMDVYMKLGVSRGKNSNEITFTLKMWALREGYCNSSEPDANGHLRGYQNWKGQKNYSVTTPKTSINVHVHKVMENRFKEWVGNTSLEGAQFDIYAQPAGKTKTLIGTVTTDQDGSSKTPIEYELNTSVTKTTFFAKEKKAPAGFSVNTKEYSYTITHANYDDDDDIILGDDGNNDAGIPETPLNYPFKWKLSKKDSITNVPVPNAKFKITYNNGTVKLEKEVTTNASGEVLVDMGSLFGFPDNKALPGNFSLQETSAPKGYKLDSTVYKGTLDAAGKWSGWNIPSNPGVATSHLEAESTTSYIEKEAPKRGYASIQKYGADTETAEPLSGYSFEGIQYTVYANENIKYSAKGTWAKNQSTGYVLTCNASGLADWVDKSDINKMLPNGNYYFKETKGNAYYRNDDSNKYEFSITADNLTPATVQANKKNDTTAKIGNTVPRADINFTKYRSWRDAKYVKPLENIPFLITWEHDGVVENHIAVTNTKGKFDSASFGQDTVVNVNDGLLGKGFTKDSLIKTSELDNTHGVYFGRDSSGVGVPKVEGQGAIPVGVSSESTITIQELWCENNANYESVYSCVITVGPNGDIKSNEYSNYSVKGDDWSDIMPENPLQNTIRNNPLTPTIASEAKGKTTGTHMVALNNADGVTTVSDTVTCGNLEIGHKYEIQGRLVDKSTGKVLTNGDSEITQNEKFTASNNNYETVMDYTFDMSGYMGKACVVLVKLFDLSEAEYWGTEYYGDDFMMVEEASLDNEAQTVFIPGIETDAYDFVSEDHQIIPTIHDLVDARKENSSADANGSTSQSTSGENNQTSTTTENSTEGNSTTNASTENTPASTGGSSQGSEGSENLNSGKVTATDLYVEESTMDIKDITFSVHDKITMRNFVPGVEYYFKGKIFNMDGKEVAKAGYDEELKYEVKNQEEDVFVVDFKDVEIKDFNINRGLAFYVEEEVYYKDEQGSLVLLAEHKDSEDERQKLYLTGLWSVFNNNKDVASGSHQSAISEDGKTVTLSDNLILHNLCEGYTYKLTNEARFTDTGKVAVVDGKELSTTREITVTKDMVEKSKTEEGYSEVFEYSVSTASLRGKTLVFGEYLSYKDNEINVHNRTNDAREQTRFPDVKTTAQDTITLTSMAALDSTVFVDKVELSNLQANTQQQVKGILMDKETGEYLGKDLGLDPITSECEVFTTAADDSQRNTAVEIKFTIPNSLVFAGKQAVVFEDLYTTVDGKQVRTSYHRDINDLGQTLTFVNEKTTATWENGTKLINAEDREFVLNDVVHYTGLIPGKEYTQEGKLWQDDGNGKAVPFFVNGVQVTSSVVFTPETSEGDITIPFTINTKDLAGETIVVFEDLYYNGIKIATHSDLSDREQTVYVPKIGTTATDSKTGEKKMTLGDKVSLTDVVEYSNLEENTKYTIKGKVIRKDNEKVIKENELTFITTEASGTTEVEFKINTNDLQGKDLVVYEYVYDMQGNLVAMHEDIDDEGQTVSVPKKPKVPRTQDTIMWLLLAGSAFIISGMWLCFKKKKNIVE